MTPPPLTRPLIALIVCILLSAVASYLPTPFREWGIAACIVWWVGIVVAAFVGIEWKGK